VRRTLTIALALAARSARAEPPPEGGGATVHPPILVMRQDGRDDARTLGFDLRASRPATSWLSWVAGVAGVLSQTPDAGGTHAAWAAVAGVGLDLRAGDRVTIGALVGVGTTYGFRGAPLEAGPGGEVHLDVKVARIRGQWLELGAYVAHTGAITSAGVSARYAF
jgi:CBS domain-containing protein